MSRLPSACKEARADLAEDTLGQERIALHRARCEACQAHEAKIQRVRESVLATETELGRAAQARLLAQLSGRLDELAAGRGQPRPWRGRFGLLSLGLAAAVLLLVILWPRPAPRLVPMYAAALELQTEAASEVAREAATGLDSADLELVTGGASRSWLEARPGRQVLARWGERAQVALWGPGRVLVEDALVLERGRLLIEAEPGALTRVQVGALEVRAMGALLSVEAKGPEVAVLEGRAEVYKGSEPLALLEAQQRWSPAGRGALGEVLRLALQSHARAGRLARARDVGALRLEGQPEGAEVSLDGQPLGRTPLAVRLAEGPIALELSAPGHSPMILRTRIQPGQTTPLGFTLSPVPALPEPERQGAVGAPPEATAERAASSRRAGDDRQAQGGRARRAAAKPASAPPGPALTAERLYEQAEAAMAQGELEKAEGLLRQVVSRFPKAALAESALYELARLEYERGRLARAEEHLEVLLAKAQDLGLHESGLYLLCRLRVEGGKAALGCLEAFRRKFPVSSRDQEVLALLIRSMLQAEGCQAALPFLEEHKRRYPKAKDREELDALLEGCL